MASSTETKTKKEQQIQSGADILVESLVRHGVDTIFAYPGGASMPLHQALRRYKDQLRTILPRHEQGGSFAAQGYARATGKAGVCMATSGPGATNLVTAIADAKLDSIPIIAITGQVGTPVIGSDAFQETPIVEVCRGITKHHYLVTDINDVPRVVKEAFHVATTGRQGPVLIDMPKDVQLGQIVPDYDCRHATAGLLHSKTASRGPSKFKQVAAAIKRAKRPIIYAGGGIISSDSSEQLRELQAQKTGIPLTMTVMGLGSFPNEHPHSLDMLGMHGSVYANYAINEADLVLALGVRFDDRVTGKLEEFCKGAKIVHIDIDPSELNKNKPAHIPIVSDLKFALTELNKIVEPPEDIEPWQKQCAEWKQGEPVFLQRRLRGHPAAARHCRAFAAHAGSRLHHHGGRGPAPNVGRAALQVQVAPHLAVEFWPGHHGLWVAFGCWEPRRRFPTSWSSTSTATAASR